MAIATVPKPTYSSDADGDFVAFNVTFPAQSAPRESDVQFTIEYRLPPTNRRKTQFVRVQTDLITTTDSLDGAPSEAWGILAKQLEFSGKIALTIKGTSASGAPIDEEHESDAGNSVNTQSSIALTAFGPELARQLNLAPVVVPAPAPQPVSDAVDITAILSHVDRQLKGGLAPVWNSLSQVPTKGGVAMRDVTDLTTLTPGELEECWAQHISEWLVCTPYGGPGPNYVSGGKDQALYNLMINAADPAVPIIFACQQLCSAAAISRGFDDCAAQPLDSHNPPGATSMQNWTTGVAPGSAQLSSNAADCNAATAIANGILVPGATFVKAPLPHAAFVLRVLQSGELQLIDTGAMQTVPPHVSPFPAGGGGALSSGTNYDTSTGVSVVTANFTHLGAVTKATNLAGAITRMRSTRPLGVARLVILDRAQPTAGPSELNVSQRLRWASELLPMWEQADPLANYSITRYIWSLRGHPFSDRFEARWLIDFPQDLAGKNVTPTNTFTRMAASRSFDWTPAELTLSPRAPNQLHAAMDVASSSDGTVRVVGRFSEKHRNNYVNLLRHRDGDDTDANPIDTSRDGGLVRLPIGKVDGAAPPPGLSKLVAVDTTTQPNLTRYLVRR